MTALHRPTRSGTDLLGIVTCVTLCLAALSGCREGAPATPPTRPDVVVISVDTLRPDHLGAYGYSRPTSPRIDRLAAEGALFENAVSSSSWTLPAHAALFTGLPDSVHGCNDSDRRLADDRTTLAEIFAAHGYRTVGFFSGPFLHPAFGLDQGFERYVDCSSYAEQSAQRARAGEGLDRPEIVDASHRDITSPRVRARVGEWLERAGDEPFFLFIHLWDVHFDYIPPPPYDTMFDPDYRGDITGEDFFRNPRIYPGMSDADLRHVIALYDGEIAWTDHHIDLILDDLEARGRLEDTIVVLLSDHGEEFFEHGSKGHRQTLFDESIRIPLVIWYPKKITPGTRVETSAGLIDVFPTLLDLAGIESVNDTMGVSLVPLLRAGDGPQPYRIALSELDTLGRNLTSFRDRRHKLLVDNDSGLAVTFDLDIDRRERLGNRVSRIGPSWEAELVRAADATRRRLAELRRAHATAEVRANPAPHLVEQLESLGYLEPRDPRSTTSAEQSPIDTQGSERAEDPAR